MSTGYTPLLRLGQQHKLRQALGDASWLAPTIGRMAKGAIRPGRAKCGNMLQNAVAKSYKPNPPAKASHPKPFAGGSNSAANAAILLL